MTATRRGREAAPDLTTVDDLLKKMRAGINEVHDVKFRDLTIPLRVLSQDEYNTIRRNAKITNETNGGDETDFNIMMQKMALIRASEVRPGTPGVLSEKLLSRLTNDELAFIYGEYVRVNDMVNPNIEAMSEEQFRMVVDALKKNTISSRDLSLPQLREICTAFVDLILRLEEQRLRTASSSGGQPQTSP